MLSVSLSVAHKYGEYDVLIGSDLSFDNPTRKTIILTDCNVLRWQGSRLGRCPMIVVEAGEVSKSLATVENILEQFVKAQVDRSWTVVGFGGGVVCDLAGFVSSIYMRGLSCELVPTSLLAQVDASVGGKNGVNLGGLKNIAGLVRAPCKVICDLSTLQTLPENEFCNGLAEALKHAWIASSTYLSFLENNCEDILGRRLEALLLLVSGSVLLKRHFVERDESESGIRRVLNFGHTVGHALEMQQGLPHGYAVAYGMRVAARISECLGLLSRIDVIHLDESLRKFGLLQSTSWKPLSLMESIQVDKKRVGDRIAFVALEGVGRSTIVKLSFEELASLLRVVSLD